MPLLVGIDLGTTNSCLAVYRKNTVEIVESKELEKTIPSIVFYNDDGKVVVGKQASKKATLYPKNGVYDSKRMIGCKFKDERLSISQKLYPFKVTEAKNGECEIIVTRPDDKETHLRPEEISAEILMELKRNAEAKLKEKIVNVVIAVPAYFNIAQKEATKDAAEIAGLHVVKLMTEPVAAALAFVHNEECKKNRTILVYDLGGGTFDVSLIKLSSSKKIEVVASGGDNFIGGRDFDQNLLLHILETETGSKNPHTLTDFKIRRVRRVLETHCEEVKKILSNDISTEIELFGLNPDINSPVDVQITREIFEKINMELFQRTIDIMDRLLAEAKMSKNQIDEVLLVGGSTRIPKIQQLVRGYFDGKKLNNTVNPDEAVAIGAAIHAALLSEHSDQKCPKYTMTDVVPRSLGVEVLSENTMSIFIKRNTKIPCIAERTYLTCVDFQSGVLIKVFEGESSNVKENICLGEFSIEGLTPMKAGQVKITVRFQVDMNGLLKVTATESSKNRSGCLEVHLNNGRLTKEEKEEAFNRNSRKF